MAAPAYTFKQFQAEYPNDDACLFKLMEVRHGGTEIECPGCKAKARFHLMSNRKAFACQLCGHHIYPCAGTIFHKSSTKLTTWFFAMYLMTSTRHGVAAKEIERQTGVTYKTAWRMCHELRRLMADANGSEPLSGHVEIDETYIGGKPRKKGASKRGRGAANKTIAVGMAERGGNVRVETVPNIKAATLQGVVVANVAPGSRISTDELSSYVGLEAKGYDHQRVAHGKKEFVSGDTHVNSVEGYWSRLKNSIQGTHVHVSKQHL